MPVIAHFIDTTTFGGAERATQHLIVMLRHSPWTPVLFHHEAPGLKPLFDAVDAAGVPRRVVPRIRGPRQAARMVAFARAIRDARASLLHAHLNWPLACSGGIIASAAAGVPAIATVQLVDEWPTAWTIALQRAVVPRLVKRYVAVSEAVSARIARDLPVPAERIRVVRNGIDPGPLLDLDVRTPWDTGRRRQARLLTLARLDVQKDLISLIDAMAILPDVDLDIAGEGPERPALEARVRELGLEDRVTFLGFRDDAPALLADADVFVLPSRMEGLPLAVLEALAAARPVVATAVGGTPEVVRDGTTGLLVPPGQRVALADAVRRLLDDRALAHRMGLAGRELVEREHTAAVVARAVAGIYQEVVGT